MNLIKDCTGDTNSASPKRHSKSFGIYLTVIDITFFETRINTDWRNPCLVFYFVNYGIIGSINACLWKSVDEFYHFFQKCWLPPIVCIKKTEIITM